MSKISAVLITLNCERTLSRTLETLQWCDERVLVDSGSKDATLEIARRWNCRIMHRDFDGFATQKQFAVDQAKNDWVFVVDGDEYCELETVREIEKTIAKPEHSAYGIRVSQMFLGKQLKYGGVSQHFPIRLFDRRKAGYDRSLVHEKVIVQEGSCGQITQPLLHDSYANFHHYFQKFNEYTTLAATQMHERGKSSGYIYAIMRFPIDLFSWCILRRMLLDGVPGIVWAFLSAFYGSVKYLKLAEMTRMKRSSPDR